MAANKISDVQDKAIRDNYLADVKQILGRDVEYTNDGALKISQGFTDIQIANEANRTRFQDKAEVKSENGKHFLIINDADLIKGAGLKGNLNSDFSKDEQAFATIVQAEKDITALVKNFIPNAKFPDTLTKVEQSHNVSINFEFTANKKTTPVVTPFGSSTRTDTLFPAKDANEKLNNLIPNLSSISPVRSDSEILTINAIQYAKLDGGKKRQVSQILQVAITEQETENAKRPELAKALKASFPDAVNIENTVGGYSFTTPLVRLDHANLIANKITNGDLENVKVEKLADGKGHKITIKNINFTNVDNISNARGTENGLLHAEKTVEISKNDNITHLVAKLGLPELSSEVKNSSIVVDKSVADTIVKILAETDKTMVAASSLDTKTQMVTLTFNSEKIPSNFELNALDKTTIKTAKITNDKLREELTNKAQLALSEANTAWEHLESLVEKKGVSIKEAANAAGNGAVVSPAAPGELPTSAFGNTNTEKAEYLAIEAAKKGAEQKEQAAINANKLAGTKGVLIPTIEETRHTSGDIKTSALAGFEGVEQDFNRIIKAEQERENAVKQAAEKAAAEKAAVEKAAAKKATAEKVAAEKTAAEKVAAEKAAAEKAAAEKVAAEKQQSSWLAVGGIVAGLLGGALFGSGGIGSLITALLGAAVIGGGVMMYKGMSLQDVTDGVGITNSKDKSTEQPKAGEGQAKDKEAPKAGKTDVSYSPIKPDMLNKAPEAPTLAAIVDVSMGDLVAPGASTPASNKPNLSAPLRP